MKTKENGSHRGIMGVGGVLPAVGIRVRSSLEGWVGENPNPDFLNPKTGFAFFYCN